MMRILVTGADGYIGLYVVDRLLENDDAEVIALGLNTKDVNSRAERHDVNIFDHDFDILQLTGNPDVVLHLAWQDGFIHDADSHMGLLSSHYLFCKGIIDGGIKHLAVMGSMHEVGYYEGAIDENTPCNPVSMYGVAKDALRRSLFLATKDKDMVFQWLRGYYIYGDDKRNHSIFAKICAAEDEGEKTFPFTSGENQYDFIHVEELAKQIVNAIMQNDIVGIINCCSGVPVSLSEKVEYFIREHGFNIRLEYGAFPDRSYDSPSVWGDNTKISTIMSGKR
jgi:dTDP-6-deoxy-L-talose 4-dehydrogenase (NAD+)